MDIATNKNNRVVVALSGGVDSAVAAVLLKQQGYEVFGVTLKLWSQPGCEQENRCCTPETRQLASEVALKLQIPFEILDAKEIFRKTIVENFLASYVQGDTPSPCPHCNRGVKWKYLLNYADSHAAEFVATGHYARIHRPSNEPVELWKGLDQSKDQAYMLSLLSQSELRKSLFPLNALTKAEVRQIAKEYDLPAAELPDSQDLCFLGEMDYRDFLRNYVPSVINPGLIKTKKGETLGKHQGLAFYTIGQRKGLPSASAPLYVLEKDQNTNTLIVGFIDDLGRDQIITGPINWISGTAMPSPFHAEVKIRFKAEPVAADITPESDGSVLIKTHKKLRDITPGQLAVIYLGDQVLGGGFIRQ